LRYFSLLLDIPLLYLNRGRVLTFDLSVPKYLPSLPSLLP